MKKQNNIIIIAIPALVISIALIGCSEKAITEKSKAKLVSLLDAETPEISDIPVEISELDDLSNEVNYEEDAGSTIIMIEDESVIDEPYVNPYSTVNYEKLVVKEIQEVLEAAKERLWPNPYSLREVEKAIVEKPVVASIPRETVVDETAVTGTPRETVVDETAVTGTPRETVVDETAIASTPRETVVDETAKFISEINYAKLKWITIIKNYKISIDTAYLELQAILSSSSSSISKDEEADLPEEGTAREKFEAAKHAVKEAIRSRDEELTSIREEYNMNEYNL